MNTELKQFLESNIDLVDNKDYDSLFDQCEFDLRAELCQVLFDVNIDPLPLMHTIPERMFRKNAITTITIPSTITSIGAAAFRECSSLTSIVIPEGVTSIGYQAFSSCTSLKSIVIPNSVTRVGSEAFRYCDSLTSVVIGDSVTSIDSYAFHNCTSLTNIVIPNSVTSISYAAFYNCTSLTSIVIPRSITRIDESGFSGCTSLKEVHISDIRAWCGLSFDDRYSNPLCYAKNLYLNGKLVTELVIPEGVTRISDYAFINCIGLTGVTIPSSVTCIAEDTFEGCLNLTEIRFNKTLSQVKREGWHMKKKRKNGPRITKIICVDGEIEL